MVYEETIKNIRATPFWDDDYLTQSPYLEKLKNEIFGQQKVMLLHVAIQGVLT